MLSHFLSEVKRKAKLGIFDRDLWQGSTLLDQGGAVYNIKAEAFGAAGNGSTDDTAAIKAAIASASLSGGVVYAPQGTYKFSSQLVFPPGVTLEGAGIAATKFQWAGGSLGPGSNDYAQATMVFQNNAGNSPCVFGRYFSVVGQYGGQNVNDSYSTSSAGGIEIQGKGLLTSVSIAYCMDGVITNTPQGHFYMIDVNCNFNFNGIRWFQFQGDHCYIDCDLTLNSFASSYIDASCQIIETLTELRVHRGFCPVGIYQDASNTNRMFRDCNMQTSKFEKVGNECIVYGASQPTTAHEGGWGGVNWNNPVTQGSATYVRTSGTPTLTSTGYGVIIGALEDDNKIMGHGTFNTISITMPQTYQGQGRIWFDNGAGNVINPTITNNATHPAPQSSWLYLSGQSPRGAARPARNGFNTWAFDPSLAASSTAPTMGVLYFVLLAPESVGLINYVSVLLATQGTGTGGWTSSENLVAVYDTGQTASGTATLLQSVDVTSLLSGASSNTEIPGNITAVQAYPDGDLYAAFLLNSNWGTTQPTFMRGAAISGAFNDLNQQLAPRYGTYGTNQTSLPGTVTISSIAKAGQAWWAGFR